jgi:hypothetical protein
MLAYGLETSEPVHLAGVPHTGTLLAPPHMRHLDTAQAQAANGKHMAGIHVTLTITCIASANRRNFCVTYLCAASG